LVKACDASEKHYALKILRNKYANSARFLTAFHDEYRNHCSAYKVAPSFVCKPFEYLDDDNVIVFEYLEHFRLTQSALNELTFIDKLRIFISIVFGILTLHTANIIHGDIHHNNILKHPNNLDVKLIDFGISVAESHNNNTPHGGHPGYMPPERSVLNFFGSGISSEHALVKSDVYQLGVLGYFIFEDDLPFAGSTWKELYKNVQSFNVRPMLIRSLPIGSDISDVILEMINPEPDRRLGLSEASALLEGFLNQLQTASSNVSGDNSFCT